MGKKTKQLFIFNIRRVSFVFLFFDQCLVKLFGIITSVHISTVVCQFGLMCVSRDVHH